MATAAALAVTAPVFDARQWGTYIAANALIALTYALVGVLIGTLFGRVGGVFIAFLVPAVRGRLGVTTMLVAGIGTILGNKYLPAGTGPVLAMATGALIGGTLRWRREPRSV